MPQRLQLEVLKRSYLAHNSQPLKKITNDRNVLFSCNSLSFDPVFTLETPGHSDQSISLSLFLNNTSLSATLFSRCKLALATYGYGLPWVMLRCLSDTLGNFSDSGSKSKVLLFYTPVCFL